MRYEGEADRTQLAFWVLWGLVGLVKLLLAARLPPFVDEAFYWQEGQHLAAAHSDLPAAAAWLVVRIAAREFGASRGWVAGSFALLLPLAGTLGLLALPDAAMALATLLCIDAGARLLRRVDAGSGLGLAAGLSLGALSHYRFIAVIGIGLGALLLLSDGRRALRGVRGWTAIAIGASA